MRSKVTINQRLPDLVHRWCRGRALALAGEIAEAAKALAPVRTGRLRDSITVEASEPGAEVQALAPYSGWVEYGTASTPAQPFLRPALAKIRK